MKVGGATARRKLLQENIQNLFLKEKGEKEIKQLAAVPASFSLSVTIDHGRKEGIGKWKR